MLLQALTLIAFMLVVSAAMLASSLLDAKIALEQTTRRHITAALQRGTDDFATWTQRYVATHGSSTQTWPQAMQSEAPRAICTGAKTPCPLFETTSFRITGSSAGAQPGAPDTAQNLQSGVQENRVAGFVTVTIANARGETVGSRARLVTMRVFNADPYAVVTGTRDMNSTLGDTAAGQGDTAGYEDPFLINSPVQPDASRPTKFRDTRIKIVILCTNSLANNDQTNAFDDNQGPGNQSLPWGVSGRAFETPCNPTYAFAPGKGSPDGATQAVGDAYPITEAATSKRWSSNERNIDWPMSP